MRSEEREVRIEKREVRSEKLEVRSGDLGKGDVWDWVHKEVRYEK